MGKNTQTASQGQRFGLLKLISMVFSSVIGIGIFNIAENMAAEASAGAVLISWVITAAGMLFLVYTFKILSDARPDLNAGIYQYAQTGFGNYMGFNIAWGYWLCTAMGNVAYAVMLNDSLGAFWAPLLEHGFWTIIVGSALIWLMYAIVVRGIRTASIINVVMTGVKIATLAMIVVILVIFFRMGMFTADFWGQGSGLGSLTQQIKSTMLVTLWCFIGIEGAVMMSARAKRQSDVGRASIIGFFLSWVLYVLLSVLCFGVMSQAQMAQLPNPSLAYILISLCGQWAYYFVISAVIVSLLGGWVSWTIICAQVPYEAAAVHIFPGQFLKLNRAKMPAYGLLLASLVMQVFILMVTMAKSVYMAALELSGMMVLPAYLFCGLFLLKASCQPRKYLPETSRAQARRYRLIGVGCILYCAWLLYAGGLDLIMLTSIFYVPGIYFFVKARRQSAPGAPVFTRGERWIVAALCLCAAVSIVLLCTRHITL